MKRFLDLNPCDFLQIPPAQLKDSIRLSEGRVVIAEVIASAPPMIDKVSNAELAAAFGADLILLNMYDVLRPQIVGLPDVETDPDKGIQVNRKAVFGKFTQGDGRKLTDLKAWIGRPVGLNLEPIENPELHHAEGRLATAENAERAIEQGADFIVITGNPNTGVTSTGIVRSVKKIREAIDDRALLLAGKTHAAGSYEPVVLEDDLTAYVEAGADGVVLPAPGTVPGVTLESSLRLVTQAHRLDAIVLNAIGTSQEGASQTTIEQIALMSKMSGADAHHIGDAGTIGIAIPENIYALSLAIRGRRHTWHRMAASLKR
jgi:hypothetical protein